MIAVAGCGQSGSESSGSFPPVPNPTDPLAPGAHIRPAYPPGSTDPALLRQQPPTPAIAVRPLDAHGLAVSYAVPPPTGPARNPVTLTITIDDTSEDRYSPVSKRLLLNGHLRGRVRIPFGLGPPPTEVRAKTATRTNLQSDSVVVSLVRG